MTVSPQRMPSDPNPASRPTKLDSAQLGFTPRPSVAWLSPAQLTATGVRVAFAAQFGAYLDKRELQGAIPTKIYEEHAEADELWVDFIADLGDGFDPTYTMAYLLAQESIEVGGETLPRGKVLLMGGDQVYPTARSAAYEDRLEGPYRAALPTSPEGAEPALFALPGNHDWYDGLTAFLRLFARKGGSHVGGWKTSQTRSYFALKLPHRWWVLALDVQGSAYLDDPQLEYFKGVADNIKPGDRVILLTPQPAWVQTEDHPRYYDTFDYFLRNVIEPTGALVPAMISGDHHHYARYGEIGGERQLITCGGGGAYTAATHHMRSRITVPPKHSQVRRGRVGFDFALLKTYPTKIRSQWLGSGVFARLPFRNPGFATMLGVLHTMLLLALDNAAGRIVTVPIFLMVTLVLAACVFFAAGLTEGQVKMVPFVLGGAHGVAHVALAAGGLLLWRDLLPFHDWTWPLPPVMAVALYLPVAGLIATFLVSAYLLIASNFRVNVNELFAGQGIEDYKSFMKLHFKPNGELEIYVIGVDTISKKWKAQPTGSWFGPARPLKPRLVDDKLVFAPAVPPSVAPEAIPVPEQPAPGKVE